MARESFFEKRANHSVELVKAEGTRFRLPKATVTNHNVVRIYAAQELQRPVERGDRLIWHVPNGTVEEFVVEDPSYRENDVIGCHYYAKVRNTQAPPPMPSSITINQSGENSRANFNSQDRSINLVRKDTQTSIINDVRQAILSKVEDTGTKVELLKRLEELENAKDTKDSKTVLERLAAFTTAAQSASTVITPFLPHLIAWAGGG